MSNRLLLAGLFALTALPGAFAQNPAAPAKTLSEGDLLKTLDSISLGDPTRRAPLSVGTGVGEDSKKEEKKPLEPSKAGATEITSKKAALDQKAHQAVFTGDVIVKSPDFNVVCDKLTAFLRHDEKPAAGAAVKPTPGGKPATPTPAATPANGEAKPAGKAQKGGGLERAIAEAAAGKKVLITQDKIEPDKTITHYVGKAERAEYDSRTGDVVLTGWPEVQSGINSSVATERGTVMTLNREGRMTADGPTKMVITDASNNVTNGR